MNDPTRSYTPRKEYEAEATTFSSFARSQANEVGGRYREVEKATVVGVEPTPPDLPAPDWANDASGVEPPLGYRIDEQEPLGTFAEVQASLAAASTPSPDVAVEKAGSDAGAAIGPSFTHQARDNMSCVNDLTKSASLRMFVSC
jgi:hypothetical protein